MGFNITLVGPSWSKGQPFLLIFGPLFFPSHLGQVPTSHVMMDMDLQFACGVAAHALNGPRHAT